MHLFCTTCIVGEGESKIKGKTVGETIKNLCDEKGAEFRKSLFEPESGRIRDDYVILVNGKPIDSVQELNLKVKKRRHDCDIACSGWGLELRKKVVVW